MGVTEAGTARCLITAEARITELDHRPQPQDHEMLRSLEDHLCPARDGTIVDELVVLLHLSERVEITPSDDLIASSRVRLCEKRAEVSPRTASMTAAFCSSANGTGRALSVR